MKPEEMILADWKAAREKWDEHLGASVGTDDYMRGYWFGRTEGAENALSRMGFSIEGGELKKR